MPVNRHQLMNELEIKLWDDREGQDNFADVARQVEFHWKSIVTQPGEHYAPGKGGYSTGDYRDSIHRESVRATKAQGGNRGGWRTRVVTFSEIAHFLEYGTTVDEPGTHAWWIDLQGKFHQSPFTPTPAFAWAAQVERDFS